MSIDEELRALEREDWRAPRALALRSRMGEARTCIFCGHALDGTLRPCARRGYEVGQNVYLPGSVHPGNILGQATGPKHVIIRSSGLSAIGGTQVIEVPDSWLPGPCACDHADVPHERTMQEYQECHGVTLRVLRASPVSMLYHTVNRNADGTPQRWRVSGALKLWKRTPGRFRLPLKQGMYNYGALTEDPFETVLYRTEETWAYSYGELIKHNMSRRGLTFAKLDWANQEAMHT